MDVIVFLDGLFLIGNSQYLAFVRVEFQFVFGFPGLEYMEVTYA